MISLTIGDYYDRCVESFRTQTAITYKDQSFTYQEMGYRAKCFANALQTTIGLKKDAKIAFLSGYGIDAMDEFTDRIKASPIKDFLTKPVELADLSTTLTRMLKQ